MSGESIVMLARAESPEQPAGQYRYGPGRRAPQRRWPTPDSYTTVGLGSQILRDMGVGKIHLMGAPIKYNAISGFDLEVLDFVNPDN